MNRIWGLVTACLLFLMLALPHLALADPGPSIRLFPPEGHCGDLVEATVNLTVAGTYRIYWHSITAVNRLAEFTRAAGNHTVRFRVPETPRGTYMVHLARDGISLANTTFVVWRSVEIDPTHGPVGTHVTITGRGFAAGERTRVSFLGIVQEGTANSLGSWNVTHTIPPTPGGSYSFEVDFLVGTIWYDLLERGFRVTPKISATPSLGRVGQTILIEGTGFGENERNIQVTFDGEVRAVNILANEKGSWDAVITIPPRPAGTYLIDASGILTRARVVPDINFNLGAGILVEPSLAYVGETITVAGGGFRPGETGISVTFGGRVVTPTITADRDGLWETSFVLPASTHGSHNISARGDITAPVTTTLTIRARIESPSPAEGAPGDSVSLSGSGFFGDRNLTITVGGVAVAEGMRTQPNGNVVISFRVPKGVTIGPQTVRVTDGGGATDSANFTVTRRILPTPLPTLPPDESTLRSGVVVFHWQGVSVGNDVTYTLEISEIPGGPALRSESGIAELSYTLTREEALPRGTYYWRVMMIDDYGNESDWSEPSKLTVAPIPTWVWVVVGLVVLIVLLGVAYRETKFKVTE